ncbi:peptidase [Lachnospiraceae bacterium WCA-9-b2]|jgi:Zn-dependent membrane protease YugP|uniref:Peptidase n=1 Tax=Sporofaciens musculi TaxID=2681861 RepID=A0A7X3MJG8_9FIRM|nr:zinc metallopeptidase [Sporofaciens musculi]MCI9422212.1 zinc metallopeptidase [Dorea sp.]MXP77566.1 peptidase [Sporofaciens musculi]
MYYGMDPTYILVVIGLVICLLASAKMKSTFSKYSKVRNHSGITGRQAAEQILRQAGIYDVQIEHIAGDLTDHYDPRSKVLRLSDATYNSVSVAALGVAAHECGHAIQHDTGYAPLQIRGALVPVVNFGSAIAWPLILIGLFFNSQSSMLFLNLGILAFSLAVLFQIVTLPVEFNASSRAIRILGGSGILYEDEVNATKKVLFAAALTYVAGAVSAALQLLRIILLANNRRR